MQTTHFSPRLRLPLSLGGLALVIVACSGKVLDKELVVDTSHTDVGDPAAPSTPTADAGVPSVDGDGAPDPATSHDGGSSPKPALPPPSECDPRACALPGDKGFSLVLIGDTRTDCPSDFATADVVEDPVANPGACSCGTCSATVNCSTGSIASAYGDDGECTRRGPSLRTKNGACDDQGGRLGDHASIAAPRAVVGECSARGVATRMAVATTQMRTCTPGASTCDRACDAPKGMMACVMKDGDVECPASAPTKHLVGSDFTLTCDDCGCDVAATCDGKMRFYKRKQCEGSATETIHVGECTETNGQRFASTRWHGSVGEVRCRKDAPPPPNVGLAEAKTICCPS